MLSPFDIAPKGKADSIWSFDSGYCSNTLDDDEKPQHRAGPGPSTQKQHNAQPFGLGISDFWNVHVEDKLRVRKPESPIDPITTRLNVFTVKAPSSTASPSANDELSCVTCQLWDITKPGQSLKCEDCKSMDVTSPDVLYAMDPKRKGKLPVPKLDIPQFIRPEQIPKKHSKSRCSAGDLAGTISPSSTTLQSCIPDPDLLSPTTPVPESTVRRSCARRTAKLPPYALQHLRAWLKANREHPYPNAEAKRALAQECGLTEKQVTTWLTNTRARKLAHERSTAGSEDEGAEESDYCNRANTPMYTTPAMIYDTTPVHHPGSSMPELLGTLPAQLTVQTSRRGKKKDYRRVNTISPVEESPIPRTPATPSPNPNANGDGNGQEMWQCTFCYQHLVPKSWRRHEETQHRPKHQWTCLATGPRLEVSSRAGTTILCAFCQMRNPDDDHFDRHHRITECMRKREEDRTFGRPDHLRQHIRNFHKTSLLDLLRDKWRRDGPGKNVNEGWTCGFCKAELKTWDIRETHIANHFKDGKTMADWHQGLPQPAAQVVHNRRRQSQDIHTTMLSRLQSRFTGRSIHQLGFFPSSASHFSNTFDPIPSSSRCMNIAPAPVLPEITDMGFGGYMPGFTGNLDFSSAPLIGDFNATYPLHHNTYGGVYQGDEALHMDFDDLTNANANSEFYGNLGGHNGVWNQERH